MRLTEQQLRKIIRGELVTDAEKQRLQELGIKDALVSIFKGLGAMVGLGFGKGAKSYNHAPKVSHVSGKSVEKLSPKTDAYDQVYALYTVLDHIGSGIDLAMQTMEYGKENLDGLEIPVEPGDEKFSEDLQQATEWIAESAGTFGTWLSRAKSSKISSIGADLQPAEKLTDLLKNFAEAVSALESADPAGDWGKIVGSKAVQQVIEKGGETSESMKNLINEVTGGPLGNIKKLPQLKILIDESFALATEAEKVMDFAAEEEGEKPEDSELLDHIVRETELRVLISGMISRAEK